MTMYKVTTKHLVEEIDTKADTSTRRTKHLVLMIDSEKCDQGDGALIFKDKKGELVAKVAADSWIAIEVQVQPEGNQP